ncbi:MAG: ABC transporter substrate-binding protein [Chloroflexota bacterium]|nr:MAG: ABC transporter substrate-binding protein [Chloroflexota bacterium]
MTVFAAFVKPRRQTTPLAVFVLAFALFLYGCSTGANVTPTPQPTSQATGAGTQQALPESGGPEPEGFLRVAMQPVVQTDPAFISSDPEVLAANAVYDYLVDVTVENTIAPRLATAWDMSDDGLTYVFTLAEGVSFHDGSPFSAGDVVWTFNRLRNDPGLPTAALYANIDSIVATGDLEVTFTLKQPNPFFLFDLSDNHALVIKAGTQDPANLFNGTGPFKLVDYAPEDRLIVEAYPDYFMDGQPGLPGVEFIFFNDQSAQVDALRGGQVDLVMAISTDLYASLQNDPEIRLLNVPTNGFDLIRLRADRKPGSDPRVIQALKLATDREVIYQLVLQGLGSIGRDSPIGPIYSQYYTEEFPLPERDVAQARALLAEAGYENGLALDLHTPDTGNRPNLAVLLKEQWAEAGVNLNVIVEPESVYYGDNGWLDVDLGITGWGSRPYPQFYLDVMLVCGAVWNEAHFCDEEFDRLVMTAGTSLDEQERVQAYHEIQRILIERGPVIIPYFFAQLGAVSSQVTGFEMKAFPGRSDLRNVTLSGR